MTSPSKTLSSSQKIFRASFIVIVIFALAQVSALILFQKSLLIPKNNKEVHRNSVLRSEMESSASSSIITLPGILSSDRNDIVSILGLIYEHSAWVAEELYDGHLTDSKVKSSIKTVRNLSDLMKTIVDSSTHEQKLTLLREHPDLCEKISVLKNLTEASQEEQCRAGLQYMTEEEREIFTSTNNQYKKKFGFPFILAVRNASKYTVLSAIKSRVKNSVESEVDAAIGQVHKIAWMRLLGKITTEEPKGFLTCHVLDTATGSPAAHMRVHLRRILPEEDAGFIAEFITNEDGRLMGGPALKGKDFKVGTYEWTFFVSDYFASRKVETSGTAFLSEVPIRFGIDDPDEHYHVPLLVSPWSYSTYRGS